MAGGSNGYRAALVSRRLTAGQFRTASLLIFGHLYVPAVCENRIFSTKKALPLAHTPDVDVHEVRTTIVTDSSPMQAQGHIPKLRRRDPR